MHPPAVLGLLLSVLVLCSSASALGIFGSTVSDPYKVDITAVVVSLQGIQWSYKTAIVPSSGGYIQVTNFSSSFTLPPQLYFGRFTFMAGCAHYSMRTHSDNETEAGLLVVESDIWEWANLQANIDAELDSAPGLVSDSLCLPACQDKVLGLDPHKPYQMLALNGNLNDTKLTVDWATYDAGAPECAGTMLPDNVTQYPGNVPIFPLGLVQDRQVLMDYQDQRSVGQPSAQTANLTAHAEYTINNASCIFLSMWMPDILPQDAAKYSVALYTSGQFTDAVFDLDASQPYNLTFCTGATCNATAGTWVKQYGLSPGHTYFVVGSYDWSVTKTNALQRSYAYVQAFTAEECVMLQRQDAAAAAATPPGAAIAQPNPSSSRRASKTGAIAGGVVGGAVAAGVILAAGIFLLLRHKHRHTETASNLAPLSHGSTGYSTSDRSSVADVSVVKPASSLEMTIDTPSHTPASNDQAWAALNGGKLLTNSSSNGSMAAQWTINPACIRICQHEDGSLVQLGQGAFGSVYKAVHDDVREVAVKVLQSGGTQHSLRDAAAFWTEIERLSEIRDKNIIQFYGCVSGENVMLVTEYCEGGDLFNALANMRPHCDSILCWHRKGQSVALDVARGLHVLHSRQLVHFDIKSPNILLTKNFEAKVGDVGLSHPLLSKTHLSDMGNRGTWAWQAPELLLGRPASMSADIWSYGVLLYELITGERPQRGQLRSIRIPQECPLEVELLMDACLEETPSARPNIKEVINRLRAMVQSHS